MRLGLIVGVCAALVAGPAGAALATGAEVLHVPPGLFAAGGPLGALQVDACRIVLADGPGGSLLRVSPAMARMGFRDIGFTVPPLQRDVAFGPLATTLRLRIPGPDPADPGATIQSTRLTMRIAGTSVELTADFESQGAEMTAEYYAGDPRTGENGWVRALDVEADNLTVTVSFPVRAEGAALHLGAPSAAADFSFAVTASGLAGLALDDTFAKDAVRAAVEGAVAKALDLEAYRRPLATTITAWLGEGPFKGLPLKAIRVLPAADGGMDLVAVTAAEP